MPTQIVKWNPVNKLAEDTVSPPLPARKYFPDWYRKSSVFSDNQLQINKNFKPDLDLKACVPFMDAMSGGYIQETWQDIIIRLEEVENGKAIVSYAFPTKPEIMGHRDSVSLKIGEDFYPMEYVFHPAWAPELPSGWSMIYTSPFNRLDLPFQILTGIVDSDRYTQNDALSNVPFFIRKSFQGIIPKGTPFLQMIPIKRENWESVIQPYSQRKQNKIIQGVNQHLYNGYKKTFWTKKNYN